MPISQTFYADLGLYFQLEVASYDSLSDTVSITEELIANGLMELSETLSLNETDIPSLSVLTDNIVLSDIMDGRVRGVQKTLYISDERFFSVGQVVPQQIRNYGQADED